MLQISKPPASLTPSGEPFTAPPTLFACTCASAPTWPSSGIPSLPSPSSSQTPLPPGTFLPQPRPNPTPGPQRSPCSGGQAPLTGILVLPPSPAPCLAAPLAILSNDTSKAAPTPAPLRLLQDPSCPFRFLWVSRPSLSLLWPHPLTCRPRPLQDSSCYRAFARAVLGLECSSPLFC